MNNEALIVWLLVQTVIELLLCGSILYLLYGRRSKRKEVTIEEAKLKQLVVSCDRVVHKHRALSDLWGKVEKRGAALETCVNSFDRRLKKGGGKTGARDQGAGHRGISSYAKTVRLLERGVSVGEIAEQVGLPRGEVELIMNLKKR